jgi:hypothetical protein
MKLKFTFFITSLFFLLTIFKSGIAQNDSEDQIKKIEGTIDKITITSDGKEYIFEGKEATELFEKMKSSSSESFVWTSIDDDKTKRKVIILNSDGDKEVIEIEGEDEDAIVIKADKDFDSIDNGITKKVKVEIEDGDKKVTVTTKENGEETTEVYEGNEADEYIEKMKSENGDINISVDENTDGKKVKNIIIETEKDVN